MITGKNINLRLAEVDDADFILSLRTNKELNQYISTGDYSLDAQIDWLKQYKLKEKAKSEYYFIIESKSQIKLGTIRIYDLKGDSFCWGSWLLSKGAPAYAAIESSLMLYDFAFLSLGFKRSHFDVRKGNANVVAFHKRFGATVRSSDDLNYYFTFPRENYLETRKKYKKHILENQLNEYY